MARPITVHDVIRLRNWPGTHGKRFTVVDVDHERGFVHAIDADYRRRSFPLDQCIAVRPKGGRAA